MNNAMDVQYFDIKNKFLKDMNSDLPHYIFIYSFYRMIYKCVMCDTVFTQKPLLYMHFDTHLAKQKVHVFKCPDCTKLYAQKGSMMEHIKVVILTIIIQILIISL